MKGCREGHNFLNPSLTYFTQQGTGTKQILHLANSGSWFFILLIMGMFTYVFTNVINRHLLLYYMGSSQISRFHMKQIKISWQRSVFKTLVPYVLCLISIGMNTKAMTLHLSYVDFTKKMYNGEKCYNPFSWTLFLFFSQVAWEFLKYLYL